MSRHLAAFSLLELTVVLAIISVIAGAGIALTRSFADQSNDLLTEDALKDIQQAMVNHRKLYGHFPCPAPLDMTVDEEDFGRATDCTDDSPGSGVIDIDGERGTDSVRLGALPVRELNLSRRSAVDAWENKLLYGVTRNLATNERDFIQNMGDMTVLGGSMASPYSLTTNRGDVAWVVVSYGGNALGAIPRAGTAVAQACGSVFATAMPEDTNCDNDHEFRDVPRNTEPNTSFFFDDFIIWGTKLVDGAMR